MLSLKKSLGQHFLVDEEVCITIVSRLREIPFERLLEIGPGGGALTKYLVELEGVDLRCIEIDQEKVNYLQNHYPQLRGKIINEDILTAGIPFAEPFTVVGNFPYNISTQIVFRLLEWRQHLQSVTGMFQKEVAERIAAREGSRIYGVTSVLTQAYFDVEYLFEVPESAFRPPPKVKSAVIRFTPKLMAPSMKSERSFTILVKTAFNQRRKTLRNAVKGLFAPEALKDSIFNKRAEELSVNDFAALSFTMNG
jgi:16S rRNA (adenine1518-N6/adenine1519-N6)-dimethyltransferase